MNNLFSIPAQIPFSPRKAHKASSPRAKKSPASDETPSKCYGLCNANFFIFLVGLYLTFNRTKNALTFHVKGFEDPIYSPISNETLKTKLNGTEPVSVPHIIHLSYKTEILPEAWAGTPSEWARTNPGMKIMFWTDEENRNLIETDFPWFLETYDNYIFPIQRADSARYFVMLKYGGLYADLDIIPIRNVSHLLGWRNSEEFYNKEMMLARTVNGGLTNAIFAGIPNSPILEKFVRNLHKWTDPFFGLAKIIYPHMTITSSAGSTRLWSFFAGLHGDDWFYFPTFMWRSWYWTETSGLLDKVILLDFAGWGQCDLCYEGVGNCVLHPQSYFKTVTGGSWHSDDMKFSHFLLCKPQLALWLASVILITFISCLLKWCKFTENSEILKDKPPPKMKSQQIKETVLTLFEPEGRERIKDSVMSLFDTDIRELDGHKYGKLKVDVSVDPKEEESDGCWVKCRERFDCSAFLAKLECIHPMLLFIVFVSVLLFTV